MIPFYVLSGSAPKTINGKTYNTDTAELIGEWDNISTNVGKTLTPWGVIPWCLHLRFRSPCHEFVSFQCFRTIKNKELFLIIRSGYEEQISKIETGLSPVEWEVRLQFLEDSFLDQKYHYYPKGSIDEEQLEY